MLHHEWLPLHSRQPRRNAVVKLEAATFLLFWKGIVERLSGLNEIHFRLFKESFKGVRRLESGLFICGRPIIFCFWCFSSCVWSFKTWSLICFFLELLKSPVFQYKSWNLRSLLLLLSERHVGVTVHYLATLGMTLISHQKRPLSVYLLFTVLL